MKAAKNNPLLARLRYHVTGSIERGEAEAITEIVAATPERAESGNGCEPVSNHTKGKWTASRMLLAATEKDRRSGFVVNGPDADPLPVRICDIRTSPEMPFAEARANASLIASAPDMLEALEYAAEVIDLARRYFPKSIRHSDRFQLENACATIGKAIHSAKEGVQS